MMNKLKTDFVNTFIIKLLKTYSINKKICFKKLPTSFIHNLNKSINQRLFEKQSIKENFEKVPISSKYKNFDEDENKKIIEKIYIENKEKNVIKILELTYEELFIIYRRALNLPEDKTELEKIKAKIEGLDLLEGNNKCKGIESLIEKLKKNYDEDYIKKIKASCLEYINWFKNKNERKFK